MEGTDTVGPQTDPSQSRPGRRGHTRSLSALVCVWGCLQPRPPGRRGQLRGGSCGRVSTLSHADCRSNSDMAHILVQSHAHRPGEGCGAVPFSWRIRDYVEELWVQARYISEAAGARAGGAASGREVSAALRAQGLRRARRPGPPEPPAPGCAVTRRGVGRQRSRKTSIS